MPAAGAPSLYVFIDESGNFDFSPRGTCYFVMSAFITETPLECARELAQLTYEFLARGLTSQVPFHASENSNGTRHRVVASLCPASHNCFTQTVVVDKRQLGIQFRNPESLYANMGLALSLRLVSFGVHKKKKLVLLFDATLTARQRRAFFKLVKPALNRHARHFTIAFRAVSHDVNGQRADIYAWATFRLFEHGDATWFHLLPGAHTVSRLELK
jgi:hypothetical protein